MEPLTVLIVTTLGLTPSICDFPMKSLSSPPHAVWKGRYENDAYGYSVTIPRGSIGYSSPEGGPQHGFGIVIGSDDRPSYASVDGSANSLEHPSAAAAAAQDLEYIKRDATLIGEPILRRSKLGNLPAVHLTARFRCRDSGREYIETTIIALSANDLIYRISLYADPTRFNADRHVWDALVASFAERPRRTADRRTPPTNEKIAASRRMAPGRVTLRPDRRRSIKLEFIEYRGGRASDLFKRASLVISARAGIMKPIRQNADSCWTLAWDLASARALIWVASVGRPGELTPEGDRYLFDRYRRLAAYHRERGRTTKASRYELKANEHCSGDDGPPYAAAMALQRPRRYVQVDAVSTQRLGGPDDAA